MNGKYTNPGRGLFIALAFISGIFGMSCVLAESLVVVGFNVESGDSNPDVIDEQIALIDGVDIWGLSEVANAEAADLFEVAAAVGENAEFDGILGTTGGGDRLMIIYDQTRLALLESFELDHINIGGNVRAPLVGHFRVQETGSEFLFMINHLYRSRADRRHQQAELLNEWAREQTLPVLAVGDYNFDWDVSAGDTDHDQGYDNLIRDGIFSWVRPATLIKTNCSPHNSVLDFVFAAGLARQWIASSEILFPQSDYCPDDDTTSDHRPVLARFELDRSDPDVGPTKAEILQRLDAIEAELNSIRALVDSL